jgi:hypothetical protein
MASRLLVEFRNLFSTMPLSGQRYLLPPTHTLHHATIIQPALSTTVDGAGARELQTLFAEPAALLVAGIISPQ